MLTCRGSGYRVYLEVDAVKVIRNCSRTLVKGSPQFFTGSVFVDPLILRPSEPSRVTCASVTFEPGARTAWHTHPSGQILVVTAGCGLVQEWGGGVEKILPGDVVWIPPGVKHWHGAAPHTMMTHIAIQEEVEGRTAEWMEHVTDDQYPSEASKR